MKINYCIHCQEDVIVGEVKEWHITMIAPPTRWDEAEYAVCYGPFASVQPPVNFEEDWDLNLVEPGQEELAIMNCRAEELLQDFDYTDLKF